MRASTIALTYLSVACATASNSLDQRDLKQILREGHTKEPCLGVEVEIEVADETLMSFCEYSHTPNSPPPFQSIVDTKLKRYVAYLKSFIYETMFDVKRFEAQGEALGNKLIEMQESIGKMTSVDNAILSQLAFAHKMYQTMVDSIEPLKYYESSEPNGRHFIWTVIDLNVRILGLRDSHGQPDYKIDNIAVIAHSYLNFLSLIQQGFDNNYSTPTFGKQMMFKTQMSHAHASLTELVSRLPSI